MLDVPGDDIDWEDREVDYDAYAYISKQREAQRQAELEVAKTNEAEIKAERERKGAERRAQHERRTAWSIQTDRRDKREVRRDKKEKKKDWEYKELQPGKQVKKGMVEEFLENKNAAPESGSDDDEDMDAEYKQLKKGDKEEEPSGSMFDDLS